MNEANTQDKPQETQHLGWYTIDLARQFTVKFPVRILEKRKAFGRVDVLITPVGGYGKGWVDSVNVSDF